MKDKWTDQEKNRIAKLVSLQKQGLDPFITTKVKRSCTLATFRQRFQNLKGSDPTIFCLSGRVLLLRQTFGVMQDFSASLQFYFNKKNFDSSKLAFFNKYLDIGDFIMVIGNPFVTKKGELTINIQDFKIIAKAIKSFPEKWHGLQNEELKIRFRYVDLIQNQTLKQVFLLRSQILYLIRQFFHTLGFLEVETPILHTIPGGANARPFKTFHNALKTPLYLRIAPELYLKKLIIAGFEKIYEIGRLFRNEGMDAYHNPEFSSIEVYAAFEDLTYMMVITQKLFSFIAQALKNKDVSGIDWNQTFECISMQACVKQHIKVDFATITTNQEAIVQAQKHNIKVQPHQQSVGHIMNLFFEQYCIPHLKNPTFVYGFPTVISPLAKKDPTQPHLTQRFELYINGQEYANAFSELNDPIEQYERFKMQQKEKKLGNCEVHELDYDFIEALSYALPPTAGLGIGIDRLVMLFSGQKSIRNVLFFPHLKPKNN